MKREENEGGGVVQKKKMTQSIDCKGLADYSTFWIECPGYGTRRSAWFLSFPWEKPSSLCFASNPRLDYSQGKSSCPPLALGLQYKNLLNKTCAMALHCSQKGQSTCTYGLIKISMVLFAWKSHLYYDSVMLRKTSKLWVMSKTSNPSTLPACTKFAHVVGI